MKFRLHEEDTHREYLQKSLARVPQHSSLVSAACAAGLYDAVLQRAGHSVIGIDQSGKLLARARERFPQVQYEQMGLQEMNYRDAFEGATCIDAMEHVCPEDWPGILENFREALKPGGVLYLTVVLAGVEDLKQSFERSQAQSLPVVMGEIADKVAEAYERELGLPVEEAEEADDAAYHFCPPMEQVRVWIGQAGLTIEDESRGNWYAHFLVRKGS